MKMFSELINPELEAFVLEHDGDLMSKSQLPAKDKLKDTVDDTHHANRHSQALA